MNTTGTHRVAFFGLFLLAAALAHAGGCASHPKGQCGPACPAIEAATSIGFPSERLDVLKRIAAQEGLSTHEQIYLVNAVSAGGFSSDQADALVALISNPCCTAQTRQHIAKKLKWMRMLGNNKRRVIDALIEHSGTDEQDEGAVHET